MYLEMPMVARCCCCAPLRYGLLVWAYVKLIMSIFVFGVALVWMFMWMVFMQQDDFTFPLLIISTMISLIFDIVFNFVLIVGAHKKNTTLLRLYYRYGFAHAIIFLTLGLLWIGYAVATMGKPLDHPHSVIYIVAMASAVVGPLFMHIYLFIVLRSEIYKLKAKDRLRFVNPVSECIARDDFTIENRTGEQDQNA